MSSLYSNLSFQLKDTHVALPGAQSVVLSESTRFTLAVVLLLLFPFIANHVLLWVYFRISHWSKAPGKIPPMVPHSVPFLGSTIPYLRDPLNFIVSSTRHLGKQVPVGVRLLTFNLYLLQGPENIISLWKTSSLSTATAIHGFCLAYFFGMPKEAVKMYTLDDSGCAHNPHPESTVKANNRVDYRTHESLLKFLCGAGLVPFFERFLENLKHQFSNLNIGEIWIEMPDFLEFFQLNLTPCVIEAMCGPYLLSHNSEFVSNFWEYNLWLPALSKGLPKFLIPEAFEIREKILCDIKRWHTYARRNFDKSKLGPNDADPFWGCGFIRDRQEMFSSMDNFGHDAKASSDFGVIWATNTNAIIATFWSSLELFRDPSLLFRVRQEVAVATDQGTNTTLPINIDKLLKQPLLQSTYAEVLRLRVHVYVTRCPERRDLRIRDWIFPKGKIVLVSSTPAHIDNNAWNEGQNNSHPVNKFWAERFLVDPETSCTGPGKKDDKIACVKKKSSRTTHTPDFSLEGMSGSWIPYGGGARICPGRHFAKREIMMACAIMVSMFDVEILAAEEALEMNPADYGLGVLRPAGKVPFRIRRRRAVSTI